MLNSFLKDGTIRKKDRVYLLKIIPLLSKGSLYLRYILEGEQQENLYQLQTPISSSYTVVLPNGNIYKVLLSSTVKDLLDYI